MPKCTGDRIEFGKLGRRLIEADFSGGELSSDGGMMLLKQVDERIGLTRAAAAALGDARDPGRIVHSMRDAPASASNRPMAFLRFIASSGAEMKRPNVEFSGCARLYRAASAGTPGSASGGMKGGQEKPCADAY